MVASMSSRTASASGAYVAATRPSSSSLKTSNVASNDPPFDSAPKNLAHHCFCAARHPQVVVQELAAVVGRPARGDRDGVELASGPRQLVGGLTADQDQRVAGPGGGQPGLPQQVDL